MVLTRHVSRLHQVHNSRHLRSGRLVDVVHTTKMGALALSTKSKPVQYKSREWVQSEIGDLIDRHEADADHGPDSVMGREPGHMCAAIRCQAHPELPAPREETAEKGRENYLAGCMENMGKTNTQVALVPPLMPSRRTTSGRRRHY